MGYHPYEISYIRLAEELGIGKADTKAINIHELNQQEGDLQTAVPTGKTRRLSAYVKPQDACSACYGSLIHALGRLEEKGVLQGKEKIAIGQGYRNKTGTIGIGQCTK